LTSLVAIISFLFNIEGASGLPTGFDIDDIFEDINSNKKKRNVEDISLTRINKLLEEPPELHSWVLDGVLGVGSTSLLCSAPKVGKTTLLYSLTKAICRGEDWLGMPTLKSRCVVLFLEDRRNEIRQRYDALGMSENDDLYVFCGRAPHNPIRWLQKIIEDYQPGILIADTWGRLFSSIVRDINCYVETTRVFDDVIELARTSNTHLLFTHHLGKKRGVGTSAILGSTGLFSSIDTAILLQRYEKRRTIQTVQRYGTGIDEEQDLILDPETMLVSLGGKENSESMTNEQKVESVLMTATAPLGLNSLREQCRIRKATLCQIVNELVQQGRVKKSEWVYELAD